MAKTGWFEIYAREGFTSGLRLVSGLLGSCGEVFRYRSEIENRYVLNIVNQSFDAIAVNWHKHPFLQENVPYRQLCQQFRKGAEQSCQLVWFNANSNVPLTHLCAHTGCSDAVSSRAEKF